MVYESKILLINEIIHFDDKYFLNVELDYKGKRDILWEVDSFTGGILNSLIDFDGKSRYRLSFYTPYTYANKKMLCFVTKTYRDQSEPIYFPASDSFIESLTLLKDCESLGDLDRKIFTVNPSKKIIKSLEEGKEPYFRSIMASYKHKISYVTIPVFSLALVLLVGFFAGYYQREINYEEKVSAAGIEEEILVEEIEEVIEEIEEVVEEPIIRDDFELEALVNYKIPEGKVALTFDDGPSIYTKEIVDILDEYNIPATFFFLSRLLPTYSEEVIYAEEKGYAIGSHSVSHAQLTKVSQANKETEILSSMTAIEELIGKEINLFRPPYGSYNKAVENLVAGRDAKIVMWNIDTRDWEVLNGDKIMENIKRKEASGAIILFHELEPTVEVLPRVIEYLQSLDLEIVNLK